MPIPIRTTTLPAIFLMFLLVLHYAIATPVPQAASTSESYTAEEGDVLAGKCSIFKTGVSKPQEMCYFIVLTSEVKQTIRKSIRYTGYMTSQDTSNLHISLKSILENRDFGALRYAEKHNILTTPITVTSEGLTNLGRLTSDVFITLKIAINAHTPTQAGSSTAPVPQYFEDGEVFWAKVQHFRELDGKKKIDTKPGQKLCAFIPLSAVEKKGTFPLSQSDVQFQGFMILLESPLPHFPLSTLPEFHPPGNSLIEIVTTQLKEILKEHNVGEDVYCKFVTIMKSELGEHKSNVHPDIGNMLASAVARKTVDRWGTGSSVPVPPVPVQ